ncbi:hypothetical protein RRG08_039505 [Elysia crispata]|uniref:Uncharacterized protein n=1 Tax=Elysia crispata TaxID=231223 RepID=A0AAE0YKP0_9GAST|nr:hypothetical protein RRG08_039505 [Elysia crispata]
MVRGEKYWKIEELDLVMCACSSVASGLPAWIAVSTSIARWNMTLISTKLKLRIGSGARWAKASLLSLQPSVVKLGFDRLASSRYTAIRFAHRM